MRILVINSDPMMVRTLGQIFSIAKIQMETVSSGDEAVELLSSYSFSLTVIDMKQGETRGFDTIRKIRMRKDSTPILVLTADQDAALRVRCLNLGADDVVTKPADQQEILARMQALIRRSGGFPSSQVSVGNMMIDLSTRDVWVNDQPVRLTEKEFQVLEALTLKKGHVLTKDHFLNYLYGGMDEPDAKIIDVIICKLRKKLISAGADNLISTVWGRGYVLRDPADARQGLGREDGVADIMGDDAEGALLTQFAIAS